MAAAAAAGPGGAGIPFKEATTTYAASRVDMRALTGLRGACAAYIMIFHAILATEYPVNFLGSVIMPLFMMLSGFSITAVYGRTRWQEGPMCGRGRGRLGSAAAGQAEADSKPFPAHDFWRNRFARVMPTYLVSLLIAAPLWPLGYNSMPFEMKTFIVSAIASVVPISSLLNVGNINGPGWFLCTLVFFWGQFPKILPKVQRMSDDGLVRWIVRCFVLQAAFASTGFPLLFAAMGFWPAFMITTMHPISRFPLFVMGVMAGELAIRHPPTEDAEDEKESYMPWPRCFMGFLPLEPPGCGCGGGGRVISQEQAEGDTEAANHFQHQHQPHAAVGGGLLTLPPPPPSCCGCMGRPPPRTQSGWSHMATTQSLGLLAATLLVTAAQGILTFGHTGVALFGEVHLQALVPMAQLNVVIALTRDGAKSWASRALQTPLAQWLGRLSMVIYLIHYPLIYYLAFALHGSSVNHWSCGPDEPVDVCYSRFLAKQVIPLWGVAAVSGATLVLAELVYRVVEVPARRCLRREG